MCLWHRRLGQEDASVCDALVTLLRTTLSTESKTIFASRAPTDGLFRPASHHSSPLLSRYGLRVGPMYRTVFTKVQIDHALIGINRNQTNIQMLLMQMKTFHYPSISSPFFSPLDGGDVNTLCN